MTLREELEKMRREIAEEEIFRAEHNIHTPSSTLPRDCLKEETSRIEKTLRQKTRKLQ